MNGRVVLISVSFLLLPQSDSVGVCYIDASAGFKCASAILLARSRCSRAGRILCKLNEGNMADTIRGRSNLYDIYAHGAVDKELVGQINNCRHEQAKSFLCTAYFRSSYSRKRQEILTAYTYSKYIGSNMYAAVFAHGVDDKELYGQRAGSSYGNHYGPSPGHTWAAEAVLLASLRQVHNIFSCADILHAHIA